MLEPLALASKDRFARFWMALVLVAATACVLLAVRLMSHSLWFDEVQTANIAQAPRLKDLVLRAIHERPYPPLYFLADRASWKLRGDEVGTRLPSALFGALATLAVYLLGTSFFRARTAAAAALMFALMPGMFRYFVDANAYTLFALTSTLSAWALWRAFETNRDQDWGLYVAAAACGLGCHLLFIFHIGSHFLAGLAYKRSLRWSAQPRFYKSMTLLLLLWIAWVLFYIRYGGLHFPISLRHLLDRHFVYVFLLTYFGFLDRSRALSFFLWPLLQIGGAVTLYLRDKRLFTYLLLLIVVPLIGISLFVGATLEFLTYRYGSGIFPLTCLLGASVLEAPLARLRWAPVLAVIMTVAAGLYVIAGAPIGFFDYQDWKGAATFLGQNGRPGDTLIIDPGWSREALDYYDHSLLPRASVSNGYADVPSILNYCGAHPDGRKWLIAAFEKPRPAPPGLAQTGVALPDQLKQSGRVSLGPPRKLTGITIYPLACQP
ncbi:MAG TPA: glycosyltransferase family 39 protein [Bryobacteraceae bacterium]|nr:glycosyltransferase family 39 protein [Bryobacteraceae bacterium]